jgi:DNA-binding CsgD family transcriptional regulator
MSVSDAAVLRIVDRIYDSVEHPALWPETIDAIGELIGGRPGFWSAPKWHGVFLSRADLQLIDQHADEFGELVVRFLKLVFLSVLSSPGHFDGRAAVGIMLAQRFLPAASTIDKSSLMPPSKAAMRNLIAALWEDDRVITNDGYSYIRLLLPHLDRALRLQMRHTEADIRSGMLCAALDRLTLGIILIDHAGLPLWLNRRAHEIVEQGNGLRLSDGRLAATEPSETRRLRDLVRAAVSSGAEGLLPLSRGAALRPLLVLAFPLPPSGAAAALLRQFTSGIVFISDPDQIEDPSVSALRRAFNLTYREAQTAVAVSRGQGLQSAADAMGVALTTARSQLQQVFAKTGTSHQAELAGLLHRTLAQLRST